MVLGFIVSVFITNARALDLKRMTIWMCTFPLFVLETLSAGFFFFLYVQSCYFVRKIFNLLFPCFGL